MIINTCNEWRSCVTVLLVVLRVAGAAPAESSSEVFPNSDYSYDDDVFVPSSEKENFDVFDWQLCKVRIRCLYQHFTCYERDKSTSNRIRLP